MKKGTHQQVSADPGLVLRSLRKRKDWTLAEVSRRTGLPVSTLSKIENGKVSLSYDKLSRLSAGLELDIAQLFEPSSTEPSTALTQAAVTGRRSVTRAGDGLAVETENYGHHYPAADLLNKRFTPIVAEVRARSLAEFGELIHHPGEEYAYVLQGVIELHTDLYAPTRLSAGDSIYFDSGMGHAYVAVSAGPCRLLSICSETQSHLIEVSGADQAVATASMGTVPSHPKSKAAKPAPRRKRVK